MSRTSFGNQPVIFALLMGVLPTVSHGVPWPQFANWWDVLVNDEKSLARLAALFRRNWTGEAGSRTPLLATKPNLAAGATSPGRTKARPKQAPGSGHEPPTSCVTPVIWRLRLRANSERATKPSKSCGCDKGANFRKG